MEALKLSRTPMRTAFTKTANALDDVLNSADPDMDTIAVLLSQLEEKGVKMCAVDQQILDLLKQTVNCTPEVYNSEYETAEGYADRLTALRTRAKRLLLSMENPTEPSGASLVVGSRRKYKLPEIEFKKFGGEAKDWLGFWSQFKKIDEDVNIDPEDKYQYLIQATIPGSRARDLVDSFPPTALNYPKVIECMHSRFGREETLVEVYVRELLRLVLNNATTSGQKKPLTCLYDKLETQLRALEVLGVAAEKYAAMLYPLVESCLPEDTLRAWERNRGYVEDHGRHDSNTPQVPISKLNLLMKFLSCEVESEERIAMARKGLGVESQSKQKKNKTDNLSYGETSNIPTAAGLFTGNQGSNGCSDKAHVCLFCEKSHASQNCRKALAMTFEEKKGVLNKKKRCFGCFGAGHVFRNCRNKPKCIICDRRHFEVMCPERKCSQDSSKVSSSELKTEPQNEKSKDQTLANSICINEVSLQTIVVRIRGKKRPGRLVRVLLDTGSQKSYICDHTLKEMGYDILGEQSIAHGLFGGQETGQLKHKSSRVHLSSVDDSYHCNFEVLSQPTICSSIPKVHEGPWIEELRERGVILTDANNYLKTCGQKCSSEIEILIGADVAGKLFTGRVEKLTSGPVAIETNLGWTLIGKLPLNPNEHNSSLLTMDMFLRDTSISNLWKLDCLGITEPSENRKKEETNREVMQTFSETIKRGTDGRYEVSLPWIEGHLPLPSNREIAEKRLKSALCKLKNEDQLESYELVLEDWLNEGIIERVPENEKSNAGHYLPHRAVISEKSVTTRIRPVFDASCRQKDSPSLNDCLEKGPNLVEFVPAVISRFRLHLIGVISDIQKAFLQIGVHPGDRDFLRFLWFERGKDTDVVIYRHCRVVFGVSSSPFLLGATLNYHLDRAPEQYQETAKILKEVFYVDNCVTSVNSEKDLRQFICQARELLELGKFDVRGWKYTSQETEDETIPVLGLLWNLKHDTLTCDIRSLPECIEGPVTKRKILSVAQRVFDPIGFSTPVMLCPKLLLQECWKLELGWDTELPLHIVEKFHSWKNQLVNLKEVKIPRWLGGGTQPDKNYSLHAFCDASKCAYAACVYLRVETENKVLCCLVQAKARVTPLKEVTIPRLELLACTIGARLVNSIKEDLHLQEIVTYFWTDSSNALYWIKNNESWNVFVANRVHEIKTISNPDDWHHVKGTENPADLPSRGCSVQKLIESKWWEGPSWLKLSEDKWPISTVRHEDEVVNVERRKTAVNVVNTELHDSLYSCKFSSYLKIVRTTAWIKRFCTNVRKSIQFRVFGDITVDELNASETLLWKSIQSEAFNGLNDESIRSLNPVLDKNGVLRTETRVINRKDTEGFRRPVILPSNHIVVTRLIEYRHKELGHAGVQTLMCNLREQFWIVKSRKTIKQAIRRCGKCRRYQSKHSTVETGPLPEDRVRDADVFEITGLDLAGPLILKGDKKVWIVLFTCAVYRAIHLELVSSLSTECFLEALRRFIARRGRPTTLYSDNGTNLVGANNALKNVNWQTIEATTAFQRIRWKFIPPNAPWFGGWWERLIGMMKQTLRTILGRSSLHYEELLTVLCDCESIIKSRPLTYVTEEKEDLSPLTPKMFLQDIKETGVPDIDAVDHTSVNKRFRYRQSIKEALRRRFRKEYLGQLRTPTGWRENKNPVSVGDVVILGNDNTKRIDWPLAKVTEVFPGRDGKIRVVRVKTKTGEVLRPVQRLYPLEIGSEAGQLMRRKVTSVPTPTEQRGDEENTGTATITRSGRVVKPPNRYSFS